MHPEMNPLHDVPAAVGQQLAHVLRVDGRDKVREALVTHARAALLRDLEEAVADEVFGAEVLGVLRVVELGGHAAGERVAGELGEEPLELGAAGADLALEGVLLVEEEDHRLGAEVGVVPHALEEELDFCLFRWSSV